MGAFRFGGELPEHSHAGLLASATRLLRQDLVVLPSAADLRMGA